VTTRPAGALGASMAAAAVVPALASDAKSAEHAARPKLATMAAARVRERFERIVRSSFR
jgi:hypothetical protein